ncbi:MAG TPA: histidine phosphatase family protein [Candidatus Nanoperiomorbaceae bacterium]|nr:MAG: histidine phosphatase family protein [Candidatus Saccharibacteria bacterium]HMQ09277.1 histidine phosphatase family protein [Candidatus Nanoperiomorbaceae bacterium]HMQ97227.1 histidine phosphatase family protein [Candidatus Nanoperiomorbaceae bacterium]HMR86227.1 histidine phosphatase family protein [Candidatus Nanoperiomorbaceae bacterium]HMU12337.1 histidine phosphatase family protein [Candidatus Nanoperiomorbaceae bacterium]
MVTIIFEAHSTSLDNEAGLASGHNDVELSELGLKQSKELGERYAGRKFDAIFCSDLRRSYETAQLAFGDTYPIIRDERLRECDYGEMTQQPTSIVNPEKVNRMAVPFPGGESFQQCCARIADFLQDIAGEYDNKTIMIIGHRATQYGLEHAINHVPIYDAVTAPWQWQPGWKYEIITRL